MACSGVCLMGSMGSGAGGVKLACLHAQHGFRFRCMFEGVGYLPNRFELTVAYLVAFCQVPRLDTGARLPGTQPAA